MMTACFHRDHSRTDGNPEELVKQIEGWPRTTPLQHCQLLSQHEVFKDEILAVAEDSKERPEREAQGCNDSRTIDIFRLFHVFAPRLPSLRPEKTHPGCTRSKSSG